MKQNTAYLSLHCRLFILELMMHSTIWLNFLNNKQACMAKFHNKVIPFRSKPQLFINKLFTPSEWTVEVKCIALTAWPHSASRCSKFWFFEPCPYAQVSSEVAHTSPGKATWRHSWATYSDIYRKFKFRETPAYIHQTGTVSINRLLQSET